jgi:hypothetical protein
MTRAIDETTHVDELRLLEAEAVHTTALKTSGGSAI